MWQLKLVSTCGASESTDQKSVKTHPLIKVWQAITIASITSLSHWRNPELPHHYQKEKKITLGRSVHSRQFSYLGWRTLGPISWFHFRCSQNPSPSSSTRWTEDLGGSILICLKLATRLTKHIGTDLTRTYCTLVQATQTKSKTKPDGMG